MKGPEYATVKQAAERLQVSPDTVYRLLQRGELEAVKIGSCWRIPAANLNPEAFAAGEASAEAAEAA